MPERLPTRHVVRTAYDGDGDHYFVHFNRQPGVADAIMDENRPRFLRNLYRKNEPLKNPEPGMVMINLAKAETPLGEPVMSDSELAVFVSSFEKKPGLPPVSIGTGTSTGTGTCWRMLTPSSGSQHS